MVKKRGLITALLSVIILGFLNTFLFLNKSKISYTNISGNIVEKIPENLANLNVSLIVFISEWVILILIGIALYSNFLKNKKDSLTQQDYHIIKQKKTKSETDLDVLYDLIKRKKKLNISTIAKVFKINKTNALDWAKILEDHNMVTINYPTFRTPEVKLNEEKTKKDFEEKAGKEKHKQKKKQKKK